MIDTNSKRKINAYLRGVRRAVRDAEPAQRRELIRSLEEHIFEALASGVSTVDEVLSRMDPPESFAAETVSGPENLRWSFRWIMTVRGRRGSRPWRFLPCQS